MNRINISPLAFVESEPVKTRPQSDTMIEHAIYTTPSDTTEVSQFVPVHYESGYAYPLVVWLESPRENNTYSLLNSMPLVSARNYVGVSLALPNSACDPTIENQLTHPQSIDDAIERAIDQVASRYNIAEHRVFLAGCGSAGSSAFKIGLRNNHLFAGIASLGGAFPVEQTALGQWPHARTTPLFWTQDLKSTTFTETMLCEQLRMLFTAGFDVTLRQYPGAAPSARTLSDLNVWIMDQINGTDQSCQSCEEL